MGVPTASAPGMHRLTAGQLQVTCSQESSFSAIISAGDKLLTARKRSISKKLARDKHKDIEELPQQPLPLGEQRADNALRRREIASSLSAAAAGPTDEHAQPESKVEQAPHLAKVRQPTRQEFLRQLQEASRPTCSQKSAVSPYASTATAPANRSPSMVSLMRKEPKLRARPSSLPAHSASQPSVADLAAHRLVHGALPHTKGRRIAAAASLGQVRR